MTDTQAIKTQFVAAVNELQKFEARAVAEDERHAKRKKHIATERLGYTATLPAEIRAMLVAGKVLESEDT